MSLRILFPSVPLAEITYQNLLVISVKVGMRVSGLTSVMCREAECKYEKKLAKAKSKSNQCLLFQGFQLLTCASSVFLMWIVWLCHHMTPGWMVWPLTHLALLGWVMGVVCWSIWVQPEADPVLLLTWKSCGFASSLKTCMAGGTPTCQFGWWFCSCTRKRFLDNNQKSSIFS